MKELVPPTKLSHYRIVSKLGAGGMGEVYLAEDTKLDRRVALKILTAELAANRDRMDRFIREAKAAAALSHPNIAQIFEIGEDLGTHYISMEFIDGPTLRQKIHREQTDLRKLLRYLQHVAEGLAKAHAAGIVHRDLKPDNIMISGDGHAKILDFGLAKLVERQIISGYDSSEIVTAMMPQHSTPGTVMGTVGYMSPEQAQGKTKEIDQRSDIFSFGCILFEAATGTKPFQGESVIKSLHMVVYEPAPLITELNPSIPTELQRIVKRCLAKDPEDRYQSIKEVAIELKGLRRELEEAGIDSTVAPTVKNDTVGPSSSVETQSQASSVTTSTVSSSPLAGTSSAEYVVAEIKRHKLGAGILILIIGSIILGLVLFFRSPSTEGAIDSIAVLPFDNRSNAADTEYLSDGLTESLIFRLSQLPNLKVSPTSSVMRYKGKDRDPQRFASELGVSAVMTGRIAQRGEDLTISVELVDVRNNQLLWGEQYDRKMADLLATQREIAAAIVQKLQLKLAGPETKGITKRYTDSNESYQLYLKGRHSFARRNKADILRAIEYFREAIRIDPNFALAYARIAEAFASMPAYPYLSPKEAFPQAKAAAQRALEIDPTLAEAHTFLAYCLVLYDWNWTEGEKEFKRAIELDPNNTAAHFRYGQIYLAPLGRYDEAISEIKRGLELEPLDINMGATLGWVYFVSRQNDKALDQAKKTYELEPGHPIGRWILSQTSIAKGMYAEAIALNEQWLQTEPANQFALPDLGIAYAQSGKRAKAGEVIGRLREIERTQYAMHSRIAGIYAALGEKDKAFSELEKAFAERDWELHRLNISPFMDPLRGDPRFTDLIKRIGVPQ